MNERFWEPFPHLRSVLGPELPLLELGPGTPNAARRELLESVSDNQFFAGATVVNTSFAKCCRSGALLLADSLNESHLISQDLHTATASYWHGIMHRREPDYANAKYWFARVPQHEIHAALVLEARQLANDAAIDEPAQFLRNQKHWDADAFVDLCQDIARKHSTSEHLAREVALAEWRLLFAHCYAGALGQHTH